MDTQDLWESIFEGYMFVKSSWPKIRWDKMSALKNVLGEKLFPLPSLSETHQRLLLNHNTSLKPLWHISAFLLLNKLCMDSSTLFSAHTEDELI